MVFFGAVFDEAVSDLHMEPSDLLQVLEVRTRKHLKGQADHGH